jgi:hypothetical protein
VRCRHNARGAGSQRVRGLLLMECLVYLSLWFVIVGVGFGLFYQVYSQAKHLARTADDIGRVLKAGERWRQEVRASELAPRWQSTESGVGDELLLGGETTWVAYRCTTTNLLRRTAADPEWREFLGGLKACALHCDERGPVVSWRWEIEIQARVPRPSIRPRFTFQAVSPLPPQ